MNNKTLSVSIPKECLSDFIRYQLNILLVQVIPTSEINTQVNVAWHVSLPAENKSYFWNDDSELYVSPVPNINGGVINSYSKRQCVRGQMLISEFNTFSPDANPVSHADYGVINKNVQGQLTFGMFKAISVDGQNALALPVNAVTVPRTYTALLLNQIVCIYCLHQTLSAVKFFTYRHRLKTLCQCYQWNMDSVWHVVPKAAC
ncbi:hypothetical protein [Photobacterium sp. Hal280]|uniref:hypothetical protein n=1 Tax=Photobacterium sp. Hal280 TaxID=3035163 RepID=UPI00301C38AF